MLFFQAGVCEDEGDAFSWVRVRVRIQRDNKMKSMHTTVPVLYITTMFNVKVLKHLQKMSSLVK